MRQSSVVMALVALTVSDWISIPGTVVAVVSLFVAIIQGKRAGEAKRAVARAQRQIAGAMILSRTPELEAVEVRIRTAAHESQRDPAEKGILEWRRAAAEHQAFLERANVDDMELDRHLKLSLGLVDTALEELADQEVEPEDACRRILSHASGTCRHNRTVATVMMLDAQ
jgi:hypothetical protein